MSTYRLLPEAQADIEDLVDYIAEDSVNVALRIEQELHDTFELLADNPYLGHSRPDLLPLTYRVWSLYSWYIIYRPDTDPLKIFRVWHGRQRSPEL